MPATTGLSTASTRLANAAFALTYFKRAMKSVWPRVCGTTESHSEYEVFAFNGASPPVKLFQGTMESQVIQSYTINVPNPVWKNIEYIKRNQFEFDQTDSLIKLRVGMIGISIAQIWDYLLAQQMINGGNAGSQNFTMPETGQAYTMTSDNQPIYSLTHNSGGSATYSNIVIGNLPDTKQQLDNQDLAISANQLQLDVQFIIALIASYQDDKGNMLLPDFDASEQLVLIFPPALTAAMALAFKTTGQIGGSGGTSGSSGGTTSIGNKMVKDVIPFPLLQGCLDITSKMPGGQITPPYATTYYWMILGDYLMPWYQQRFSPLVDIVGGDPAAESERIMRQAGAKGLPVTPEAASMYASTEIATNLGALGNQSQPEVVLQEQFYVSGRVRGMLFPGPWYANGKIDPSGLTS